ncbi:protealysin inhibitor emfourin [Elioraea rosea]|uniref:protealysin inhibitor emfourin n=1 Tax=Elioraea rosea TaxID=2492390 RepID=UPI0011839EDB|nr:protealysin inhibitor emfourin [Elioraea rosea]
MAERIASVTIIRSGGVGGITRRRSVEAAALSEAQKKALAALAASPPGRPARGADRFSFDVTLTYEGGKTCEVTVPEDAVPEALAEILR